MQGYVHREIREDRIVEDVRQEPVVDLVFTIGDVKRGKSLHRGSCGMVAKWRSLPDQVKQMPRASAVERGLKPCKQRRPL